MSRTKRKRASFSLNTTSTADISFMLLIFFLVTSSMDTDKGLVRQLPPPDNPEATVPIQMERENIMELSLLPDGSFAIEGSAATATEVEQRVAQFVAERGENHIISIAISPQASYGHYFALQESLLRAYAKARDEASMKKYRRRFARLSEKQRDDIRRALPQRMVEKDSEE